MITITKKSLEELYFHNNLNMKEIASIYKCHEETIRRKFKKFNIEPRHCNKKFYHNHNYFSTPTIENCYWAGFIAADGCIYDNRLIINLGRNDKSHLEKFKKTLQYDGNIRDIQRKGSSKTTKKDTYFSSVIEIYSPKICSDLLNNWNITNKKSLTLQPPNITDLDLCLSYIIGYIDGDGTISICNRKTRNTNPYIRLNIIGTFNLINWINDILHKFEDTKYSKLNLIKIHNMYSIECSHIRAYNILNILLKIKISNRLWRKWNKISLLNG